MITIFKNIRETSTPFHREVDYVFESIRTGKHKDLIKKIRAEKDKTKRNDLKKNLSAVCFSGKFSKRADDAITEHSGLICLDFDGYPSAKEMKQERASMEADPFVMAVFTSPSGNGIKVICRIPPEPENHKRYFEGLKEHFNSEYWDDTSKNISRVCYESYDPKIYVNEESSVWDTMVEEGPVTKSRVSGIPSVPIEDSTKVVEILMKWWNEKYGFIDGQRNQNLFILAKALNEYGISREVANHICSQFQSKSFPAREIKTTLDSAYADISSFNTKFFEDSNTVTQIRSRILLGESKARIAQDLQHIDRIEEVIDEIDNDPSPRKFWTKNSKGIVSIVPILFKQFLEYNGFYKFSPHDSNVYMFVRVTNNLIERINDEVLKDFVLRYLMDIDDYSIYNYFAKQTSLFKKDFLGLIDTVNVHFVEDTKEFSYIYFQNCAVKVTADSIETIDYIDLDGYVWDDQVIKRDFEPKKLEKCDYQKFIRNISGDVDKRVESIESTIGFLMSSYKDPGYCPAVILNDEVITENPEGGTGKGLFVQGIGQLKKVEALNGKGFDFKTQFAFQTVTTDTQVVSFDDVKRGFTFENLFSTITEGITIEKKNKDAIKIPFQHSPKIVITTNYAIRGKGNSFERRKWELELKKHYSMDFTPVDEFGRRFFDEWDQEEWSRFDNYMIRNLQLYIQKGLIKSDFNNLAVRKLGGETSHDFLEWCGLIEGTVPSDAIKYNTRIPKDKLYMEFIQDNPDYAPKAKMTISRGKFYKWLHAYGTFKEGVTVKEGRNTDGRWIIFESEENGPSEKRRDAQHSLDF